MFMYVRDKPHPPWEGPPNFPDEVHTEASSGERSEHG